MNVACEDSPIQTPKFSTSFSQTNDTSLCCPELTVRMFNRQINVLVDTGASILAMSETLFKDLQLDPTNTQTILILPITGITISMAVQGHSKKVTQQALIPFSIAHCCTDCIFLIVPHLSTPVILGDNWLKQNQVILDYQGKSFHFPK